MALVFGALGDPATERFNLLGGQVLVRLRRRHAVLFVRRDQTGDELALIRLPRDDHGVASAIQRGVRGVVEPQPALAVVGVLTVAVEAVFGKDGANVAVELQLRGGRGCGGGRDRQGDQQRCDKAGGEARSGVASEHGGGSGRGGQNGRKHARSVASEPGSRQARAAGSSPKFSSAGTRAEISTSGRG